MTESFGYEDGKSPEPEMGSPEWINEAVARAAASHGLAWKSDPRILDIWLKHHNLVLVGWIAVGMLFLQPLLTTPRLTLAAYTCAVAFAIAIPFLAALILVNNLEQDNGRFIGGWAVFLARIIAYTAGLAGLFAGCWMISWHVALAAAVSGLAAAGVHSVAVSHLMRQRFKPAESGTQDGLDQLDEG